MLQKLIEKNMRGVVKAFRVDTRRAVRPGDIYGTLTRKGFEAGVGVAIFNKTFE